MFAIIVIVVLSLIVIGLGYLLVRLFKDLDRKDAVIAEKHLELVRVSSALHHHEEWSREHLAKSIEIGLERAERHFERKYVPR